LPGTIRKGDDMSRWTGIGSVAAFVMILVLATAGNALAHCDGLDGPVVSSAGRRSRRGRQDRPPVGVGGEGRGVSGRRST